MFLAGRIFVCFFGTMAAAAIVYGIMQGRFGEVLAGTMLASATIYAELTRPTQVARRAQRRVARNFA